jgi:hypothetical protein
MGILDTGVVSDDFDQILTDMGRTISYKVVTRSTNPETGEETTAFATATDQTVVFFLQENRYVWDKEGLLEVGDAYIIANTDLGIKRYDQVTVDDQTYYIENITRRHVVGTLMQDYGVLFKVA